MADLETWRFGTAADQGLAEPGSVVSKFVVIVVFAPLSDAHAVRTALAAGGAGQLGEYTACSFTSPGQGRFLPGNHANPHIGTPGVPEVVDEVRVEAICARDRARDAITAMLDAHPYEEPAWHCYEALLLEDLC